jgi:hypothetical protein
MQTKADPLEPRSVIGVNGVRHAGGSVTKTRQFHALAHPGHCVTRCNARARHSALASRVRGWPRESGYQGVAPPYGC